MIFKSIKLLQFRQFDEFFAGDFHDRLNVIVGKNAQGKTTILEAISMLTRLKSFRASHVAELIQSHQLSASIAADLLKPTASQILISFEEKKKRIRVDSKKISSSAQYPYLGTSVSFVPDDLYLVKGGPDQRRNFFDELHISLEPKAVSVYQQFHKILKQRNRLLKSIKNGETLEEQLELWTDQYIEAALRIYQARVQCLEKLSRKMTLVYEKLFQQKESIRIDYVTGYEVSLPTAPLMAARLTRLKEAEKAVGYTLTGPHRDDFNFFISELEAKSFASQGQTRSLVIALKISQLELIRDQRAWSPILLLDDIISELDDERVHHLVNFLSRYPGQLFVSTAEASKLKTLHEKFSGFNLIDLDQHGSIRSQNMASTSTS